MRNIWIITNDPGQWPLGVPFRKGRRTPKLTGQMSFPLLEEEMGDEGSDRQIPGGRKDRPEREDDLGR